tara:strand:- start:110 stop:535 length:426 start_codon:yes stop_codon:yes gene_type:complete
LERRVVRVRLGPYRKNRSVKVEIEPHDTWNMDITLAHIIHPMLIQLKETKHGAPMVDEGDVPLGMGMSEEAKAKYDELGEVDGQFHARWDWVLDEMIWAFEEKITLFNAAHEAATPERDAYYKRMSNGFRLFGKYYGALRD